MDNYIYLVVETDEQDYQEAKRGRELVFDFKDGDHFYFSCAKNVVTFIYGTRETNTAYEFCQTYGGEYSSDSLLRELEADRGGYWFTVQVNYNPSKDDKFPIAFMFGKGKTTKYYHINKIK